MIVSRAIVVALAARDFRNYDLIDDKCNLTRAFEFLRKHFDMLWY